MPDAIATPEAFFGFQLGSERNIARWDKIVEYFYLLNAKSDRVRVICMGPSTDGQPFLLAIISSPENLQDLELLREINAQISDPRGLSESKIKSLVSKGRVVVCQSMSLHASEISATQMAPELAYDLITGTDLETQQILENTIFLMVPCFNPDGQIMVTDWYNEYVDTEFEGTAMPWLYHRYCGHDNNRDAFMLNLVESQYMARLMFEDWHPQIFQDHHEMGTYGARLFLAPYCEPIHPHGDPLIWRELSWYGAHMAYKLEEAGTEGVITGAIFGGWAHLGFHWMGNYHNTTSMLTESATARLATPIYIHPHQLGGEGSATLRHMPHYKPQTNFPNPWPGGWWSVRDMIEQQLIASKAVLHLAAQYRETVLTNSVHKALRQTARGAEDASAGIVIRSDQHDPLTVLTMLNKLQRQGIDLYRMRTRMVMGQCTYPSGTYFIPMNQPKRGVIKSLLERTIFPDDAWTRFQDGTPNPPYDTVTDTMAEMMGVEVEQCPVPSSELNLEKRSLVSVSEPICPGGQVMEDTGHGYLIDPRVNQGYHVVNQLLAAGAVVKRLPDAVSAGEQNLPAGAFLVTDAAGRDLHAMAGDTGVSFLGLPAPVKTMPQDMLPARTGLYRRYWGGNMDEGWTRLVLEQFAFPFETLWDDRVLAGDLEEQFDVIILPDDTADMIVGGDEAIEKRLQNRPVPEHYWSGIGESGVKNVKAFVEAGGTLITLNGACAFAIEKLGLQISDVTTGLSRKEFFCPGSTLRLKTQSSHALAFGMAEDLLGLCWNSPAFAVQPSHYNHLYDVVVSYPEHEIRQSGWLIGEQHLAGKAAMVCVSYGEGRVILYGLRPQFRAQTHGTYKLLFNALYT